jgi:hypothetical protein
MVAPGGRVLGSPELVQIMTVLLENSACGYRSPSSGPAVVPSQPGATLPDMRLRPRVMPKLPGRILQAALALGGVLGAVVNFLPGTSKFFARTGQLGWLVAFVLLAVVAALIGSVPDARAGELAAAKSEADRRLLMERLGDWTPGSGYFRWLTDEVNHKYFPHTRWDEMGRKLAAWNSDARRLNDPDLERRFSEAVAALGLYYGRVIYYLHTIDNKPGDDGYSSVPAEWSSTQPRQHRQAFADLDEGRARLIAALNGVYQAAHERGIDLSQTPRSAPTSR